MKKSTLTFLLAAIQAFLLLFLLVSGILQGWVIAHGNAEKAVVGHIQVSSGSHKGHRHGHGEGAIGERSLIDHDTFLNINRDTLVVCHKWVAVTFVVFIIAHVVLNWSWIAGMSRRLFANNR